MKNRPTFYNDLNRALSRMANERTVGAAMATDGARTMGQTPTSLFYFRRLSELGFQLEVAPVTGRRLVGQKDKNFWDAASLLGDDLFPSSDEING